MFRPLLRGLLDDAYSRGRGGVQDEENVSNIAIVEPRVMPPKPSRIENLLGQGLCLLGRACLHFVGVVVRSVNFEDGVLRG